MGLIKVVDFAISWELTTISAYKMTIGEKNNNFAQLLVGVTKWMYMCVRMYVSLSFFLSLIFLVFLFDPFCLSSLHLSSFCQWLVLGLLPRTLSHTSSLESPFFLIRTLINSLPFSLFHLFFPSLLLPSPPSTRTSLTFIFQSSPSLSHFPHFVLYPLIHFLLHLSLCYSPSIYPRILYHWAPPISPFIIPSPLYHNCSPLSHKLSLTLTFHLSPSIHVFLSYSLRLSWLT